MTRLPRITFRHFAAHAAMAALALSCTAASQVAYPVRDMAAIGPATETVARASYAAVIHVSASSGNDKSGDGSSKKPWATIARGLAAASEASAEHRAAILVAAGTYAGETITCLAHVDLYGGFDAGSWERDIFAHETTLDGQGAYRVLVGADDSRIDGFVITGGRAYGTGGGLMCDNASPVITNNRFVANHTLAPIEMRPNRFHQDGHRGGAIGVLFDSAPLIRNNVFSDNWTEFGDGGALSIYGWVRLPGRPHPVVANNVFVGNRSGTKDVFRTRSSSGGAIACSHEVMAEILNNVVAHNQAMGRSDAGGIYVEYFSMPKVVGNWVVGNRGDDDGGGIYVMRESEPLVRQNIVAGNWTDGGGVGGIRVSKEGRARIIDNIIVRNLTGGGIRVVDSHAVVEGNLVMENKGGPGIHYAQTFAYFQPTVIRENRLRDNEQGNVTVEKSVGEAPVVDGNVEDVPAAGGGMVLQVAGVSFDAQQRVSEVTLRQPTAATITPGRIVRMDDRWSVVRSCDGRSLRVWGDFSASTHAAQPQSLEVLPDYSL